MMLYPAQLYREELKRKLISAWYDPKYKYYFSGSAYESSIPDNNETRHDFVHLDKDGKVDGYFSYQIDWQAKSLYNFGLIGFADDNKMFLLDCVRRIQEMTRQGIRRAEFWAWSDNPVNKFYERLVEKAHVGRIAGRLWQSGYFDGKYHDTTIYEIFFLREVNNMFLLLALLLVASGTTFMTLYGKAKTHREQSVYMVMAIWQLLTAGITMDKFFN